MLVKSFKVAFSSLEMAQRSILSMLQKTNHDKNRTGNPVQSDGGLTKSVEQNRTGNPVQSDGRLTKSVETNRTGNPDQSDGGLTKNVELHQTGNPVQSKKAISGAFAKNAFLLMRSGNDKIDKENEHISVSKKRKMNNSSSIEQTAKKQKMDDSLSAGKHFQKTWLNEFTWLVYENEAMFCSLCITHKNKSKFSQSGSNNFRISTLREHENSSGHVKSLKMQSEINAKKVPSVKAAFSKRTDRIENAVCCLIRTAYTVSKKHLAVQAYQDLCALQLCNGTHLTRKLYQDTSACTEFIKIISDFLESNLLEKLRQSPALGVMIDESTDLSVEKHLIVYVSYLEDGHLRTSFLTLLKLVSADSNTVYRKLIGFLKSCKIDTEKIFGFSSDGAAVMMGKDNGVVKKFKTDNPYLLEMHCIAHRLALSSLDAAKQVGEVKYYESMLQSLHSYFSKSSKRIEHLRMWQEVLNEDQVKLLAVHQIRWLSVANCVSNVRRSLPSLLKTLESDSKDDIMASALFHATSSYKFLFMTHFFSDIMADIAIVSRTFQNRDINYVTIQTTLSAICDSIEQQYLVEDAQYGNYLRDFLDRYEHADEFCGIEIKRSHRDAALSTAVSKFAGILKESLLARFPKLELWEAMSIFSPETFPESAKEKAHFGKAKLAMLADHFGEKKEGVNPN